MLILLGAKLIDPRHGYIYTVGCFKAEQGLTIGCHGYIYT